ncbi:MAG TPA: hypothetical protein VK469_04875, partial [Candidatus Kapabacteria bacterium]|nr:hypothetical protein [Candidatus Kapabacteria bacterium]
MKTVKGKKMKIVLAFMPVVLLCLWITACKLNPPAPEAESSESFSKIYDKPDTATYTAVDIKQTDDGGYIILGMVERQPYLLRIDREGNYIWDTKKDIFLNDRVVNEDGTITVYDFVDPVPDILIQGSNYYFFCSRESQDSKNKINFLSFLKISDYDKRPSRVWMDKDEPWLDDTYFIYPMNAKALNDTTGNKDKILVLALNGNVNELLLGIIKIEIEMNDKLKGIMEKNFPYGEAHSYRCYNNYPILDKRYHFINIIKNHGSGEFYCQSFLKWSWEYDEPCFGVGTFQDMSKNFDEDNFPIYEINTPFIALRQSASSSYYGVKIEDKIVKFFTNFELDEEKEEYPQFELVESKAVFIETMKVNNEETVFFAGSSKNNKIVLYKYKHKESYFAKMYFGSTHIYEAHALIETIDGGLAI